MGRGNFTNCIRYFPTQAFNLSFKDAIKKMFPKYNPKTEFGSFFAVNMASGGLAAAGSLCIVYPLDYARTRLASDVGSGKKTFSGLGDCLVKTAKGPLGPAGLYAGFGVSLAGIIPYRGFQLGAFDTLVGLNPFKDDSGILGVVSTFASARAAEGEAHLQRHLRLPEEDRCRGGHRRRCVQGFRGQRLPQCGCRLGPGAIRPCQEAARTLRSFLLITQ